MPRGRSNCRGVRTVSPRSLLEACFEFGGGVGAQTDGGFGSVGDGLESGVGDSGPITPTQGFSDRGRSGRADS